MVARCKMKVGKMKNGIPANSNRFVRRRFQYPNRWREKALGQITMLDGANSPDGYVHRPQLGRIKDPLSLQPVQMLLGNIRKRGWNIKRVLIKKRNWLIANLIQF